MVLVLNNLNIGTGAEAILVIILSLFKGSVLLINKLIQHSSNTLLNRSGRGGGVGVQNNDTAQRAFSRFVNKYFHCKSVSIELLVLNYLGIG